MTGLFRTADDARQRFEHYVQLEPALARLWEMCEHAQAPAPPDDGDDAPEPDVLPDEPDWCAEDFFLQIVKPRLCELVGWDRPGGPPELRTATAYDEVHSALFHHALVFSCECCKDDRPCHR